jgi:asparagine synthase (glutamine-hydrolysing)
LKTNNYDIEKYYNIHIDNDVNNLNETQSINLYKKKLENSIKLRLRSDVKVGTCLSGGLDSSSIASIASKIYSEMTKHKFTAIHAKSTEKDNDESKYAKDVEEFSNLDLHIIEPTSNDFLNNIDEIVYTQEEPFGGPSIFMQYFVMEKAKKENCKVILDGQGGDETLLGYERYYPAYLLDLNFFDALKGFFSASKNSKLTIIQLLEYSIYFTKYKLRIKRLKIKNKYLKQEYLNIISENILEKNSKNYLDIFKLQKEEIFKTQMPHLLKYEDKNSMRNSIETRLPFIDYNVLETALNLNSKFKFKNGWTKYILRKSIENDLPKNIVWRKNKFGFEAPSKSWLDSIDNKMQNCINNSSIINEIINRLDFNTIDKHQKWKLFNIAIWERIYNVKIK